MYKTAVVGLAMSGPAVAQEGGDRPSGGECAGPPPDPAQCDEVRKMQMTDATVDGEVTVGMAVPDTVVLVDVPNYMLGGPETLPPPDGGFERLQPPVGGPVPPLEVGAGPSASVVWHPI